MVNFAWNERNINSLVYRLIFQRGTSPNITSIQVVIFLLKTTQNEKKKLFNSYKKIIKNNSAKMDIF